MTKDGRQQPLNVSGAYGRFSCIGAAVRYKDSVSNSCRCYLRIRNKSSTIAKPFIDTTAASHPPPPPLHSVDSSFQRRGRGLTLKLGAAEDVPELRRRPFIYNYYRLERPCLKHMWCCHNETGNIWTHMIAAVLTLIRLACWMWEQESLQTWEYPNSIYRAAIVLFFLASISTFCVSCTYHLKMSSADDEFVHWMCLDQYSCLALVLIGFFAGVPMGFHCFPAWQLFYIATSVAVCLSMLVALAKIPKERWDLIAAVIITGTSVGYVSPALHWLLLSEQGRRAAGPKLLSQILVTGIAVIFYTKYVPERYAPGWFDLVGNSHQLWHVAIFVSIALYGEVLLQVSELIEAATFCV